MKASTSYADYIAYQAKQNAEASIYEARRLVSLGGIYAEITLTLLRCSHSVLHGMFRQYDWSYHQIHGNDPWVQFIAYFVSHELIDDGTPHLLWRVQTLNSGAVYSSAMRPLDKSSLARPYFSPYQGAQICETAQSATPHSALLHIQEAVQVESDLQEERRKFALRFGPPAALEVPIEPEHHWRILLAQELEKDRVKP